MSQESLAERAREVGLDFRWAGRRYGNTFDANRVIHYGVRQGFGGGGTGGV